jgi:hypothetical protein
MNRELLICLKLNPLDQFIKKTQNNIILFKIKIDLLFNSIQI